MKKYLIEAGAGVTLPAGSILELSDDQIRRRPQQLRIREDGAFEAVAPVQFKRGEVIGCEGEINKTLMTELAPLEKDAPAEAAPAASEESSVDLDDAAPVEESSVDLDDAAPVEESSVDLDDAAPAAAPANRKKR